jgi:hypothetical protein
MTEHRATLERLRDLHEPYLSVPLDIVTAVPWNPGAVAHPATLDEQAAGLRWWCDACRADGPCEQYRLITAALT